MTVKLFWSDPYLTSHETRVASVAGDEVYFGHDGINPGFVSIMMAHESSGDGAVIMTNGDDGNGLLKRILNIIENTQGWPGH